LAPPKCSQNELIVREHVAAATAALISRAAGGRGYGRDRALWQSAALPNPAPANG